MAETPRISVTMALDALEEQCEDTRAKRIAYEESLEVRDNMIRDARVAKVPERTLVARTGLSRDSIHRIANRPRKA
jgi:hypothetical protein